MFESDLMDTSLKTGEKSAQDLETIISSARQNAMIEAQVQQLSNFCWDTCIDKPGSKLDHSTETCISNCVERFIDCKLFIANRFYNKLKKGEDQF